MFRAYAVDLNDIRPLIRDEPAASIYNEVKTNKIKTTLKKILTAESPFLDSEQICNLFFPAQSCPVFLSHLVTSTGNLFIFVGSVLIPKIEYQVRRIKMIEPE